ncbi:acyl-[acyl-carrier-protein] thioesterase [Halodesulfovibrio marinisediminis]|uniref:Acyl-ACP thioesterase n=1 Tax=Halodesulfovibrio marinisediminis DSM 17456 TaxID=1121457 RepID=A0A1N6HHV7_9BACT|nr:acyl-ACP thioesterase domain-containing protein [Halodesulfovibrio marinisediminis]SIO19323.1 Acyl-ACP thioesterase [Halodesulfovibrio marinisediminis DSM 17456]
MTLKGIESYTIKTYHTDRFGKASPAAFASFFEEAAANNARLHGFPGEYLLQHGFAWVLSRLTVTVDRYPYAGETISIHTWPSAHTPNLALRCFEVFDAENHLIAEGTTAWLVIDIEKRKLVPVPEFITQNYPANNPPCKEFPTRTVPRLRSPEHECPIISRKADIDINGHVNNVRYLGWIQESMPEEFMLEYEPVLIDISYRTECGALKKLTSKSGKMDDGDYLHSVSLDETGKELCRARTEWRKRQHTHVPYLQHCL